MTDVDSSERWMPVAGAEGWYSVSDKGRVRSEPTPRPTSGRQRGRVLQPCLDTKGYPIVQLCVPGIQHRTVKVHRLVAQAFLGDPNGRQVNHIDGDKRNNVVANLEYATCQENIRHCWRNGLHTAAHITGERNPNAKLNAESVQAIRAMPATTTGRALAKQFGVSPTTISSVRLGRIWKHVENIFPSGT